ncbi:hypothetical protein UK12_33365, partial [Saccharothrix sp. ST-888]
MEWPELSLADVGYSLVASRAGFEHGAVVVAGDREAAVGGLVVLAFGEQGAGVVVGVVVAGDGEAAVRGLEALASGEPGAGVVVGVAGAGGKVAFVLPGPGSQRDAREVELLECSAVLAVRMG